MDYNYNARGKIEHVRVDSSPVSSNMNLYSFPSPLIAATVIKRPSAVIKSPYVCDVRLDDGRTGLCHTPGLGCCGMVEAGKRIYVSNSSAGAKTAWTAQLAECSDADGTYYVGVHPMVSQAIARQLLSRLDADAVWKSEVAIDTHTRLDYIGVRGSSSGDQKKVYVEVKTAMVSMQTEVRRCERRAVFPEGYRKKKGEPVSPRAIKHAETLGELAAGGSRAIMLYIIPRGDCGGGVELGTRDPAYQTAICNAIHRGVELRGFALEYTPAGVSLRDEVPVYYRGM